jgi:hypothetical protein
MDFEGEHELLIKKIIYRPGLIQWAHFHEKPINELWHLLKEKNIKIIT